MNNANLMRSDGGDEINPKKIICNTRHHHFDKSFSKAHNMKQIEISVLHASKNFVQPFVTLHVPPLASSSLPTSTPSQSESFIVSPSMLSIPSWYLVFHSRTYRSKSFFFCYSFISIRIRNLQDKVSVRNNIKIVKCRLS